MASPKRRFDVCAGRPYTTGNGEEKKHWINVGRLTEWDDGGLSIELHATPTGSWFDGRLYCFEPKREGEQSTARQARPTRREAPPSKADDFSDDDLPF
ncbi:hypothetical protein [Lysobacter capsici]|uniref:hypothetical protein n=1 Tax=Lysobacter capsici TaxID=435897 RepID=UPI00287B65E1|nr:hypothetical protein [Lysobacter capsici]WND79430.1 hypothetical protein RJ610_19315 [Lysobacter capsici]WND84626.1 hypothetical protein RJ609_19330 [Lysobacter capsici]